MVTLVEATALDAWLLSKLAAIAFVGPNLVVPLLLLLVAANAALAAVNAEIWFDLSPLEHAVAWSGLALATSLAAAAWFRANGWIGLEASFAWVLGELAAEAALVAAWVVKWTRQASDHPYLAETFLWSRPKLLPSFLVLLAAGLALGAVVASFVAW
ncbi:MAG: hypothetical protein Kow0069_27640 [Promethearchaeota archaeon]